MSTRSKGRPNKIWMDCVKDDMGEGEVCTEMKADRVE